jgi:hypothetical protein
MKKHLESLKIVRSGIQFQNIVEWLNDNNIDYSNWSDLDMYIYYIENCELFD